MAKFIGIVGGKNWKAAEFRCDSYPHGTFRLDAKSLEDRIANMDAQGFDIADEEAALAALGQTRKSDA